MVNLEISATSQEILDPSFNFTISKLENLKVRLWKVTGNEPGAFETAQLDTNYTGNTTQKFYVSFIALQNGTAEFKFVLSLNKT